MLSITQTPHHPLEPFSSCHNPALLEPILARFHIAWLVLMWIRRFLLESLHPCRRCLSNVALFQRWKGKKRQVTPDCRHWWKDMSDVSTNSFCFSETGELNLKGPSNIYGVAQARCSTGIFIVKYKLKHKREARQREMPWFWGSPLDTSSPFFWNSWVTGIFLG